MPARTKEKETASVRDVEHVNEVRLLGRVSQAPQERVLPSEDVVMTVRLVVDRDGERTSRQAVDALECAVWPARLRRTVGGWQVGDVVEVTGAVRRRFFRAGGAVASRVEVEVRTGRVIRRAASG